MSDHEQDRGVEEGPPREEPIELSGEVIPLADHRATTSDTGDILALLQELRRLLLLRLIEAVQKPVTRASMLNVARQTIFDNRKVLGEVEDEVVVPPPDNTSDTGEEHPARMSHVAAAVMAIRHDLPFPPPGFTPPGLVAMGKMAEQAKVSQPEPAQPKHLGADWPPFKPPVDDF